MLANQEQTFQDKYDFQVALAIIGAGLANVITLLQINGPFTLWNTITGIIILCILLAYPPAPTSRSKPNSPLGRFLNLAYAATWSITLLTTFGVFFNMAFAHFGGSFPNTDADYFTPFPFSKDTLTPLNNTFTPFNAYDLSFFWAWLALFFIFGLFFFVRNKESNPDGYMRNDTEGVRFLKWTEGSGGQLTGSLSITAPNNGKLEYYNVTLGGMRNGQNIYLTMYFSTMNVSYTGTLTDRNRELTLQIRCNNGQMKTFEYHAGTLSEYD